MHFSTLVSASAFASTALAAYVLQDDYMSNDFFSNFEFFTAPDPTNGFVKYVDQATAKSLNLLNTTAKASWGVDTKSQDPAGRASIRLTSKKIYNKGLIIIDVQHMPFGCGTWPAFWTVGPDWPTSGEIDILEGVHEQATNAFALHTSPGCSIGQNSTAYSSTIKTPNCDVKAAGQDANAGCGLSSKDTKSYGAPLNNKGGGVYATEWTSDHIQIFFFPRGSVPKDALGGSPNPSSWGQPGAKWEKSACNIDKFFKNQQIVFDTTFCGDWAGNTWSTSTCKSKAATCNAFVQNNPSAFTNAYWNINALKVYQNGGGGAAPKPSTSDLASKPTSPANATKPTTPAANKPAVSVKPLPIPPPVKPTGLQASGGRLTKYAVSGKPTGGMRGGFAWPSGQSGQPAANRRATTAEPKPLTTPSDNRKSTVF
ncbi:hypothetical protein CC80DRAFT_467297 [Byssothecium circinans]|uniref:endo-1,3(4)-beta-glucanase n=1 Tax=Byssothecium circinans TaxID=147558 RepID=A0A6A5U5B4_9PLEO|nr:hypothetical protein CC80DRAFT_467297 [Byssothecium circinans]